MEPPTQLVTLKKVLKKKQEIVLTDETNIINDDVLAIKSRYIVFGGRGMCLNLNAE